MTNTLSGFVALVPDDARWLSAFHAALLKLDLAPRHTVLGDGKLRTVLALPGGSQRGQVDGDQEPPSLEFSISPAEPDQPSFRSTDKLALSYRVSRGTDEPWSRSLDKVWKVVRAFAPHIPEGLPGFGFVGVPPASPVQAMTTLFPFLTIEESSRGQDKVTELLVRTTSRCNQSCPFCSGPVHDTPSEHMVLTCIDEAARRLPGAMITLTGGEPTFRPSFLREVLHALQHDAVGSVQIQSNAVAFASRIDPAALPVSDRLSFFLSLHAVDPGIYDECTGTKGQMEDALKGIQRIVGLGHKTIINTVVNRANLTHLPRIGVFLADQFAGRRNVVWHFSALICTTRSPRSAEYLVRYPALMEAAEHATQQARSRGLEVQDMLSSTYAAVPPCMVPLQHRPDSWTVLDSGNSETGYEDMSRRFVKAHRCRTCAADAGCLGVPQPYAQQFGLDELQPL